MEKAFVTQYNQEVENNNLPYFGYDMYRIKMDTQGHGGTVRLSQDGKLILLDGKWSSNNEREYTLAAYTTFYPGKTNIVPDEQNQEYVTILIPKYTCYCYGNLCPVDGEYTVEYNGFKFGAANNTEYAQLATGALVEDHPIGTYKIKGLEYFPFAKARILDIHDMAVYGNPVDISLLGADGKLITLALSHVKNLTGTLNNIAFSDLSSFTVPETKDVSIDVVTFVANARTAGKTTGSVNIKFAGSLTVKANGVTLDIPVEENNTLAWTADSITFRGEPIS
jgi:hypothetical protein